MMQSDHCSKSKNGYKPRVSFIHVLFIVTGFMLYYQAAFSQNELKKAIDSTISREQQYADSLLKVIAGTKNDTLRADLFFNYFESSNSDEWLKYSPGLIKELDIALNTCKPGSRESHALLNRKAMAMRYIYYSHSNDGAGNAEGLSALDKAIALYKMTDNDVELCRSYINKADDYGKQGKPFQRYQILQEGLSYEMARKFNPGIGKFYVQLQFFYAEIGDTVQTLNYIDKALALEKVIADPTREARGFYLAGLTYSKLKLHKKAIGYLLKSIECYGEEKMQQKEKMWQTYELLAEEYITTGALDQALNAYEKIIEQSTKDDDFRLLFLATLGKGKVKSLQGKHAEALQIHDGVLKLVEDVGEQDGTPGRMCYAEIAQDYFHSGHFGKARTFIEMAINIAKLENLAPEDNYRLEEIAYRIDSTDRYYEGAYKHYFQLNALKEGFKKEEVARLTTKENFANELNSIKSAQEKKDALSEVEKKRNKIILLCVSAFLVIVAIFSIILYKRFRLTQQQNSIIARQKHVIEERHKEITDSINYAERIQRSFLAAKDLLDANLHDYFIFFKPKDVVSGDFYWASKLNNNHFALVTADSTGHGVPGAIMSLLNITSLEKAIEHHHNPADILDATRSTIIERLKKDGSVEGGKDGMDCSLCVFDFKNMKLHVAAANNPVWLVRDSEVTEIKPDKMPVGKHDRQDVPFSHNEVELRKGDIIYTLTDGFPDQFGGDRDKKFLIKNLRQLLVSNAQLPMPEQRQLLEKTFKDWIGNLEQVDDVTVIGVRVS